MDARCQDCDNQFTLNKRGPRKRFCGSIQEKTGCVYKRWRASITKSNQNRRFYQVKVIRTHYQYKQELHNRIRSLWNARDGRTSVWVADQAEITLEECNFYVEKICRAIDYDK